VCCVCNVAPVLGLTLSHTFSQRLACLKTRSSLFVHPLVFFPSLTHLRSRDCFLSISLSLSLSHTHTHTQTHTHKHTHTYTHMHTFTNSYTYTRTQASPTTHGFVACVSRNLGGMHSVVQCVILCCSMLQCVAVCYGVLQCVAVPEIWEVYRV